MCGNEFANATMTTITHESVWVLICITILYSKYLLAVYQPQSLFGVAVCAVGPSLGIKQAGGESGGSCVPISARCAFTCQNKVLNCTGFNAYENATCEFFGGTIVNFTHQQGCTLWIVSVLSVQFLTIYIRATRPNF